MSATETRQAIESILMVADNPVEPSVLAQLLEVPKADVEAMCDELAAEYEAAGRGFILARVAGGYRFQSHPDLAPYVERFVLDGQTSRLSSAALETLAIVAYKQPISRMQIAAIRGVNVDGVLRTLQQRGYVDEISRDTGPGNAVLFGTTDLFLERVGLDSTADLPPLAEFVPGADVVEALEDGLRPDPVEAPAPTSDQPAHAENDVSGVPADDADTNEPVDPAAEAPTPAAADQAEGVVEVVPVDVTATDEAGVDAAVVVDESAEGGVDSRGLHDVPETDPHAVADEVDVAEFEDVDAGGEVDVAEFEDVIDLVAEESAASHEVDEAIERPTELEEELAAIDALAADIAEADAGDAPTWSPAESSAVTTVRHDDPPEAEPAAPFRPAPGGLGGAGTETGSGRQDLATGEDLGSGEAPPLTGPDAGDD